MLIIEVKLKTYLKEYSCLPVVDPGEGPGGRGPSPLFLDQTEAQRPEKIIFLRPGPSPYLSVWMTVPPLSGGLAPPLFIFQYCFYVQYLCMIRSWRPNNEGSWSIHLKPSLPIFFILLLKRNSISNLSINQYYVFPTSEGTTRQEFNQTSTDFSTKQLPRQLRNVQFPYSTGVPLSIHSGNGKETKWMSDLTYIPLTLSVCF